MGQTQAQAIVISAANVQIALYQGGVLGSFYDTINNTKLAITPAKTETKEITSTRRDDYGATLAAWAGKGEAEQISIEFNHAPLEVYALSFGAGIEQFTVASGVVIDQDLDLIENMWVRMPHAKIEPAGFSATAGGSTLVAGTDYIIDAAAGLIMAKTPAAATSVKLGYSYAESRGVALLGGQQSSARVQIVFDGHNAVNDRRVRGVIYEALLTPEAELDLRSEEGITGVLTGKLVKPATQVSTYRIEFDE